MYEYCIVEFQSYSGSVEELNTKATDGWRAIAVFQKEDEPYMTFMALMERERPGRQRLTNPRPARATPTS